ncbi:MFS transporter [Solirubrobacter phytolaccae]|uniref:MFS transporter n=1 Tax=Solirubrobacter phytolaccae TaxID=1404360 RepID=A0A9X3N4G6_9ACTN|nr:MFS transporter [Solirubrobacter phytolaccae]MDA0179680.1 MFS transporter [Solirubrobacter phytolaccae]
MRRAWPAYRTLWIFLLLGWTVSAADRALTGPVVTWMIENKVGFLSATENRYALGGLIGGLFFAGYMLTQFPGGYLGDKYGHRTIITISLIWAGIATMLSGFITGLVAFIAIRVLTGLGEGAFYSNDRSLIAAETPQEKRSLGMGVVITGLALGITIATVFAPNMIELGGSVFSDGEDAWRMPFLILGAATLVVGIATAAYFRRQERGLPYARATLHLLAYSAVGLAAVMGVYFVGDAAGLSDLWIAILEVGLALGLVAFVFSRRQTEMGAVLQNRDLVLINLAFIAVLWNLWFFSFWSVSIVADAAGSSFGRSAMIAAFNAGAGILGFPTGGWLSDVAVRRGIGRKPLVVGFTAAQCVLTVIFGFVVAAGAANVWLMAGLLFSASTFFNAMQPIAHAMLADIAAPEHHGAAFGMNNLIGEIGAVLSPAVSGALRDATGGWSAAVFVDAALIGGAVILFLLVREATSVGDRPAGRFRRADSQTTTAASSTA